MFDHTRLCKSVLCAALTGIGAVTIGDTATVRADNADVPMLSGTYVFDATQNCLPSTGDLQNITGTMTFDPHSGKMKLFEYLTSGNPLTLQKGSGTETYSNSAKTFTLQTTTFQAFYGKRDKGIATAFSFIGLVDGGCALQVSLTLQ